MGAKPLSASLGVGGSSAHSFGHWIPSALVPTASPACWSPVNAPQFPLSYACNGPRSPALLPDRYLPLCAGEKNRCCANRDTSSVPLYLPPSRKDPAKSGDFAAQLRLLPRGIV